MISPELAGELRQRLVDDRKRLIAEIAGLRGTDIRADSFQSDETGRVDQHPADEGSELFEREKNMALVRELQASLAQVEEALRRADDGTYGVCAHCGKEIPEKRLRAKPEALHDIECQSLIEKRLARQIQAAQR
jgi:RNA polymerase-binding transcription factor DksA